MYLFFAHANHEPGFEWPKANVKNAGRGRSGDLLFDVL